jgi:MFS family permease
MILIIMAVGALLNAGTNAPLITAAFYEISIESHVSVNKVAQTSAYNLLATGCIAPFVAAFATKYGKRPVFLATGLINIIGTAIGESKKTYEYLLAARIVQGFAIAAYESIIYTFVGDIFFVHQRGLRLSIINCIYTAFSNLASIIAAQVFLSLGWLWVFHLFQIFLVIHFLALFFLCPETTYIRDSNYDTDTVKEENLKELARVEQQHLEEEQIAEAETGDGRSSVPKKKTFVQELAIFTRVYSNDSLLKLLLEPFVTMLNPATLYLGFTSAWIVTWRVPIYEPCVLVLTLD